MEPTSSRKEINKYSTVEQRLKQYRDSDLSKSPKLALMKGDDSELFDNSIKRLCAYLSCSEEEDEADLDRKGENNIVEKLPSAARRFKKRNCQRPKSTLHSLSGEMPVDGLPSSVEKFYLPPKCSTTTTDRLLCPQDFFNIPPPSESPETERRRQPPSLTLPPVPVVSEESQYEEANLPCPAPRSSKQKRVNRNVPLSYGAAATADSPIFASLQTCQQYQYSDPDLDENFESSALQRNETGSFYIPSGHTTMSTISPSRKSELDNQHHNHRQNSYFVRNSPAIVPPVPILSLRSEMSTTGPSSSLDACHQRKCNNKRSSTIADKRLSVGLLSWKCLTYALVVLLLFSLAVIGYLLVTILADDSSGSKQYKGQQGQEGLAAPSGAETGDSSFSNNGLPLRPLPESFDLGDQLIVDLAPGQTRRSFFNLQRSSYVQFNLSVESKAKLAVYGRKTLPPSYTQYDFVQTIFGSKLHSLPTKREAKFATYPEKGMKSTTFDHYLSEGRWYLSFLNDDVVVTTVRISTHLNSDETNECKYNCYGKGTCVEGKCRCFSGYAGVNCEETTCALPCSGNGIFHVGRCVCHQFWKGDECDVPWNVCEMPNCNGNGQCNSNGECVCSVGFGGKFCEKLVCPDTNCSNHGVCADGRCYCDFGWQGESCDFAYTSEAICPSSALVDANRCSGRGVFDSSANLCVCDHGYDGFSCEKSICSLDCGKHGKCKNHVCNCGLGWTGERCDLLSCPAPCDDNGQCQNGTCVCKLGWYGDICLLDGCPNNCSNHGRCTKSQNYEYQCICNPEFTGPDCSIPLELQCGDKVDNDLDGLIDCEDSECCASESCNLNSLCQSVPDPLHVLVRTNPPPPHSPFYDNLKFLLDVGSLQQYPILSLFSKRRVSVIRGRVVNSKGAPLIGVRVSDSLEHMYGFTLSRPSGLFDIVINGGGSVKLKFMRLPFTSTEITFSVGWNEIIYVGDVTMMDKETSLAAGVKERQPLVDNGDSTCRSLSNLHNIKPDVLSSWTLSTLSADHRKSTVIADSRVVQDSIQVPGTEIHLLYSSSTASGYMSTLVMYLVPENYANQLRLVKVTVNVEGVRWTRTFEAKANLTYTFGWDKQNVYRQKVYGLVYAYVNVEYFYTGCTRPFVESRKIKINGYRSSISDLGGWNLHMHHRYDVLNGVLEKGDGTAVYMKEESPLFVTLLGKGGKQRSLNCALIPCQDLHADDALLYLPMALASAPNGTMFIGDYNFVRKLTVDRRLSIMLELNPSDTAHQYYLAVHPLTSDLYISLPMRRQIWRMKSNGELNSYEIVVGTGETCLFDESCGDGGLAEAAKLNFPKGITFDSQGTLYIADERKIRRISANGLMSTILGFEKVHENDWRPAECTTHFTPENFKPQWPLSLSIDLTSDNLLFLDADIVYEYDVVTKSVKVLVGAPTHCTSLTDAFNESSRVVPLKHPVAVTVGRDGSLVVAETDGRRLNRIRMFSKNKNNHVTLLAGVQSACDCSKNCPCDDNDSPDTVVLAYQARLYRPVAIVVDQEGVLHVADQGNFKIRSFRPAEPRFDPYYFHYELFSPLYFESYIFNRHGQHVATKNLITDRFVYNFTYHVDAPHGALIQVTGAGGHRFYVVRKSSAITVENSNGQKFTVKLDPFNHMLQKFIGSDQTVLYRFSYDKNNGLLISRNDPANHYVKYRYDEFGRLNSALTWNGNFYGFDSFMQKDMLITTINKNGPLFRQYSLKPNEIVVRNGDLTSFRKTYVQDGGLFYLTTSDGTSVQYDSGTHSLIEPYQSSILRRKLIVAASKSLARKELTSKLQWDYYLKRNSSVGDNHKRVVQVGRKARFNGVHVFQIEYDRELNSDSFFNTNQAKILTVQYNSAGQISYIHPSSASTLASMNFSFDPFGRLTSLQWDSLKEFYVYDKIGRITELKTAFGHLASKPTKFVYNVDNSLPVNVQIPSGSIYALNYDDKQNLWKIITPSSAEHYFYRLNDMGSTFYYYFYNTVAEPYLLVRRDTDGPVLYWRYPSGRRSVVFVYDVWHDAKKSVFHDGQTVEYEFRDSYSKTPSSIEIKNDRWNYTRKFAYQSNLLINVQDHRRFLDENNLRTEYEFGFSYYYDDALRVTKIQTHINDVTVQPIQYDYETSTGRIVQIGDYRFDYATQGKLRISDDHDFSLEYTLSTNALIDTSRLSMDNRRLCEIRYTYDNRARLISENHRLLSVDEFTFAYEYDEEGYLTTAKIRHYQNHHWTYTYGSDGHVTAVSNASITYDKRGRLIAIGQLKYKNDDDGFVTARGVETFAYDSFGRLVRSRQTGVYDNGYFYDDQDRLVAFRRTDKLFQFYYTCPDRPYLITHFSTATKGDLTVLQYDDENRLIGLQQDGGLRRYAMTSPDATLRYVFNDKDTLIKSVFRSPYGQPLQDTNTDMFLPVGFKGQFQDPDNGVVIFVNRKDFVGRPYDPISGRWMSFRITDVFNVNVFQPQKINMQIFSDNDPINVRFSLPTTVQEWTSVVGYSTSLLIPLVSDTVGPNFSCSDDDSLISIGSECVLKKKVDKFHSVNSTDRSVLLPEATTRVLPQFTFGQSIFGENVAVATERNGESLTYDFADNVDEFQRKLARVLLNGTTVLPVRYVLDGRLCKFFYNKNSSRIFDDLHALNVAESQTSLTPALNISIVKQKAPSGGLEIVSLQLKTRFSLLNIRYGGLVFEEIERIREEMLSKSTDLFWKFETSSLFEENILSLKQNWTNSELIELKMNGKVKNYDAQVIVDPFVHSSFLSTDPNNLRLIKKIAH